MIYNIRRVRFLKTLYNLFAIPQVLCFQRWEPIQLNNQCAWSLTHFSYNYHLQILSFSLQPDDRVNSNSYYKLFTSGNLPCTAINRLVLVQIAIGNTVTTATIKYPFHCLRQTAIIGLFWYRVPIAILKMVKNHSITSGTAAAITSDWSNSSNVLFSV